jgi:ribosomal protein L22
MTEKDYAPQKNEGKKMIVNTPKKISDKTPIMKEKKTKKEIEKPAAEPPEKSSTKISTNGKDKKEEKQSDKEVKKEIEKKPIQTKPKVKKTEAVVNSLNLPISTKYSKAVCKFIKGKKIENAINDLEKVIVQKKPVPMKGEIPHRKGIMSGRYPKKAAQHFITLLKSLSANANLHEIENPIIKKAIANIGSRPYGKFGRVRRKRTHVKLTAIKKIKEAKK